MNDASGTNTRVIEVLNLLAAHPMESFTLSEIAGQLGLSNGSAHRVLTAMTEARYLSRHPKHKTYALGMALVAVGQAALARHRNVDVARREMARLSEELNVQCTASTVVDDELLFLASEGAPQSFDPPSRVGERSPFVLPIGLSHVAWADEEVAEAYLARLPGDVRTRMEPHVRRAIAVMRRRGFGIAANGAALRAYRDVARETRGKPDGGRALEQVRALLGGMTEAEVQLIDPNEAGGEGISHIVAPVFAPNGTVSFELSLSGLPERIDRARIDHFIARLRAAAAIITAETHGRMPPAASGPPPPARTGRH